MNKLVWVFHILLTLAMGLFGFQKVVMPVADLIAQGMWWVEDFAPWQVRTIGMLEVLGAIGLNAPYLIKALPRILVPLAAAGLGLTMVGAILTHVVRQDPAPSIVITTSLMVMSAVIAVRRFKALRVGAPRTAVAQPATA